MSASLTRKSTDHSSPEQFTFGFFCDCCGAEWRSLAIPFESGGFSAIEHETVRQLIWAQEHKAAFDRANLEAHFNFNYCPESGRWVCDECFEKNENTKSQSRLYNSVYA